MNAHSYRWMKLGTTTQVGRHGWGDRLCALLSGAPIVDPRPIIDPYRSWRRNDRNLANGRSARTEPMRHRKTKGKLDGSPPISAAFSIMGLDRHRQKKSALGNSLRRGYPPWSNMLGKRTLRLGSRAARMTEAARFNDCLCELINVE